MGWLTRLFGYEGRVRFEGEAQDGRKFTGKSSIEVIGMSRTEVERRIARLVEVEEGVRVKWLRISHWS